MATYPGAIYSATTIINNVNYPLAAHINVPNAEIVAIETELGADVAGSLTNLVTRLAVSVAADGDLALTGSSTLTIAAGEITATNNLHKVAVETGTTDNLDTVTAAADGYVLVLSAADSSKPIIIRHNVGNILTVGGKTVNLAADGDMVLMVYSTALSKWRCNYSGRRLPTITTKTTTYSATAADDNIGGDATAGNFTITLPAATSSTGVELTFKKTDVSANTVTIDGNASETIDGVTTKVLTAQYQSLTIICTGSEWWTK